MTPERWLQVKPILDAALELPEAERDHFIDERCGFDADLRKEVESLVAAHAEAHETGGFLDDVAPHLLSLAQEEPSPGDDDEITQNRTSEAGKRVGPWQLVMEIGRGGMGIVYLAVRADSEFRKRVAIKLIRQGMENESAIRRFRSERQILATLEHPNIARLIDGGTTERRLPYFVMEYVEGEPLLAYAEHHTLSTLERVEIFLKICSAVHYAHRRMIVHRDLKPGNVLVKKDGTPKLLDFGVAKLLEPDPGDADYAVTAVGVRIVTPAYASPEQLRGEPATVRSDIYSLGVILCELVAGCKPALLPEASEIVNEDLRRIILRAIHAEPAERYGSVEELIADLQRFAAGGAPGLAEEPSARPPSGSVAVLPFRVLDKDLGSDYLEIGIADAIITKLSNIARMTVRPTSAVLRYANTGDVIAAGRELNVEYVLEGSVQRSGDRVRVSVQLISMRTMSPVWAASFDEEAGDLLKLEDSISGQVAHAVVPHLTGTEQEQLAKRGTASRKAHEAYLRGRWHWNMHTEEGLARALVYFSQAIAEDPNYARAHAGIADYHVQLGIWGGLPPQEAFAAAKQIAKTALDLDPNLAEAHASFGFALWAHDRDYAEASHHLQIAIALNPEYAPAHQWFGMLMSARRKHDVAIASLERARRLDPHSPLPAASLARAYCNARQYERAIRELADPSRAPAEHPAVEEMRAWACLGAGLPREALRAARKAAELGRRSPASLSVLAHAEAANGDRAQAEALLHEIEAMARERYVSKYVLGSMKLAAGDTKGAVAALKDAWEDHDWWAMWTAADPRWDALREEDVYKEIARTRPFTPDQRSQPGKINRRHTGMMAAAIVLVLAALLYVYLAPRRPAKVALTNARIAKLTTNGVAIQATLSPDGKSVAYTALENGKGVLFLRVVDPPGVTRIAGPLQGEVQGLQFTADGLYVNFVLVARNQPAHGVLYRVATSGGPLTTVMTDVPGPESVSPDGGNVAFLRGNMERRVDELYVGLADGRDARKIGTRNYPERFTWTAPPAWSADGTRIACGIEGTDRVGFFAALAIFDVRNGSSRTLTRPRFQYLERIAWVNDGTGLFVVGQEQDSSFQQIWYVPVSGGEPERISNDLNDYVGVSLSRDGNELVSVQTQTLSNIFVVRPNDLNRGTQVTPGSGRYFDLAWTPDGKIVYASDATGSADIWLMNADGTGQRQLTSAVGRNYSPAVSPDGRTIVFHSNRTGNWNIWRMDGDGVNQKQVTTGTSDSNWPQFTPDGRSVVYHHSAPNAMWNIWKAPLAGGQPVQLVPKLSMHPAVSRKDGRIACWFSEDVDKPNWKVAILPPSGGTPVRLFEFPRSVIPDTPLGWTPEGDGVALIDTREGAANIWIQPVEGGTPKRLTNFTSGQIYSFDWSHDGKLVYSRGMSTSDVILMRAIPRQ